MVARTYLFLLFLTAASSLVFAAELSVQVVDSHGTPIPGATVEIRGMDQTEQVYSNVTNNQGRIIAQILPPAIVQVQASGFEPLALKIIEPSEGEMVLHLVPAIYHTSIEVMVREDLVSEGPLERTALTIERCGARTVYDALDKLVPSAYVPSRGILGHGLGISNSIALRGLGGSPTTQLLIVVDGRPDVMGLMGHPIPDFYSLTDVGSISITAGPASVLYGNRAMGGAIEIKPTPPQEGFHTDLTFSLGSYYTTQNRLSHAGGLGRLYYRASGGIDYTDGHRENTSFRNQDGTVHFSYDWTPVWQTSVQGRYGHFNIEDPGNVQAPTPGHWYKVGRGGFTASMKNHAEQAWGVISVFSSHGHHMIYDGFRSVDSDTGFRAYEKFAPRSNLDIELGADAAQYGGRARNIASGYDYGKHHVSEGGGFARARWDPLRKLRLNAGFRYDRNSVFGGVTATEFGASYRLRNGYALSLAISKGFRNPTIRELYLFPAPTPTLQPERLWNYQATFQLRPVSGLLVWVTGYYADIDNLIVAAGRYPNLKLENTGRASNRGLEANARFNLFRRVSFSSGYAFLSSTNLAPYVPENKLTYSLDVDLNFAFVSISGRTVGRTWAKTFKTIRLSGYTVATLKCTVPVGRHWHLFAVTDNLFNQKYQELDGYPMPGINAAGGMKINF